MPYEVSISGGCPWGFRLAGGCFIGKPTTIARVTPGGKAGQGNVMHGDHLIAVNGFSISNMDLPEVLEMIKKTGWTLHLTLMSPEEAEEMSKKKRPSEINITHISEMERPRSEMMSTPVSEKPLSRPSSQLRSPDVCSEKTTSSDQCAAVNCQREKTNTNGLEIASLDGSGQSFQIPKIVIKVGGKPNVTQDGAIKQSAERTRNSGPQRTQTPFLAADDPSKTRNASPLLSPPAPKPRNRKPCEKKTDEIEMKQKEMKQIEQQLQDREQEKKLPDYIKRQLKPPKPLPTQFTPQVSWLHEKLKINAKVGNSLKDPGNSLKMAAAAYPCQRIEIEGGPLSATIVHAQYNTPVGMYSATQIVNTLVNTAVARGADVPNSETFGDDSVEVDKNSSVYKLVHARGKSSPAPAQSRSIRILDAFLEQGKDFPPHVM